MSRLGDYFLAVLFLMIAFLRPLQLFVARGLQLNDGDRVSSRGQKAYMVIVIVLFTLFFYFLGGSDSTQDVREDFFFKVSACNPKCTGAYFGKPATFQFSEIKEEGVPCTTDQCPAYGMIRGCSSVPVYGKGYAPYTYRCPESVC